MALVSSVGKVRLTSYYLTVSFQIKIQSEESEEMAKFKELFPDMKSPDSLYDKSPVSSEDMTRNVLPKLNKKVTTEKSRS